MKLIVVPTDFSPLADNALKYGMDLAVAMGSSLMIVHVYQIPISYSEVPLVTVSIEEIKKESEERLAELHVLHVDYKQRNFTPDVPEQTLNLDMLLSGMNATYDFIENKDVNEGINDFAEKNNIDLIITLPQKRSFLERLFEKSLTRELLHLTRIPVMCIRNEKRYSLELS